MTFSENQLHALQIRSYKYYYPLVPLIDLIHYSNNATMIDNFSLNNRVNQALRETLAGKIQRTEKYVYVEGK